MHKTLPFAEGMRSLLMGMEQKYTKGNHSSVFSGKTPSGAVLQGHIHAHIIPLDWNKDGFVDHVLLHIPMGCTPASIFALERLEEISFYDGMFSLRLQEISHTCPVVVQAESKEWVSQTPFVSLRHYKKGKHGTVYEWLTTEVGRFCRSLDITEPSEITMHQEEGYWSSFAFRRKQENHAKCAGFRLVFSEPHQFPLLLGEYTHFGMGQFSPVL